MSASVDDFDQRHDLLNVQNGTVDLRTGRLLLHDGRYRITHICPVEYEPAATAPRFQQFLSEIFPGDGEVITYMQRFAGYTATGEVREEKFLYLYGVGSNGKGTLIRALANVFGDYAESIPADFLTKSKYSDGGARTTPAFHKLPGKRLVFAQEPSGDTLDADRLKVLSSADRIDVNPKHRDAYSFQPTHAVWMAANKRLVITDQSNAVWRRMWPVDFNQSFSGREDWTLEPTLQGEEAPGILAWIVAGAIEWYENGLGVLPQSVMETKKDYRAGQDPASVFFTDVLIADPLATLPLVEAHMAYEKWRPYSLTPVKDARAFARLAPSHGVVVEKRGREKVTALVGVRLPQLSDTDQEPADTSEFERMFGAPAA